MKRKYQKHEEAKKLIGQKFGRWTVIKLGHIKQLYWNGKKNGKTYYWLCKCDCGTEKEVLEKSLLSGASKSCGCILQSEEYRNKKSEQIKIHGYSGTRLYKIWIGIKVRCYGNPYRYGYNNYGGRGIKMCPEWEKDFLPFR